jgi:hypothetical protein
MQNAPQAYIVGLVKKTSKKTKRSHFEVYFSSRVRQASSSKKSYLKNSVNYTASTRSTTHMRGYLTIWDDRSKACSHTHPYFVEMLADHGLKFSDFQRDPVKKGLFRLSQPVPTEIFEFGSAIISRTTGNPVPGVFEIVQAEQDDEEDLQLDSLTVSKLRDLASDYSIDIPADVKLKSEIISFLKDQLA